MNHNGSIELAKKLVDIARDAGADFVKFQSFKADKLVTREAVKAEYQVQNSDESESQFEMLRKLELNYDQHIELIHHCKLKQIGFLSTPFDEESIEMLKSLGVTIGKIPSGEITNLPFMRRMAQSFDRIILSTGMSNMDEIGDALKVLTDSSNSNIDITVLHCNTEYPTPFADVNLNAMRSIAERFSVKVGYSDHTMGIEVPIAAVAMGAGIIEKHFTISRNMEGPDHKASLEPEELKEMVRSIRHIEMAMGSFEKTPTTSELKNRVIARRSIVAAKKIMAGEIFTDKNLTAKRPGSGISPMLWNELIGKKAIRSFKKDEMIEQ